MRILLTGAAVLALAAGSAVADPGKGGGGNGNGNGGGSGKAAQANPGGGGKGNGGGGGGNASGKGNGGGGQAREAKADRGGQGGNGKSDAARGAERKAERSAAREVRGNGNGNGNGNAGKAQTAKADKADRGNGRIDNGRDTQREVRLTDRERGDRGGVVRTVVGFDRDRSYGLIDGCPPGLAKKNNGCQPPGLARQGGDNRDAFYQPSWFGYPHANDGRYFYDDGYLYRMNNSGSVLGYIPLLGGALSVGNPWPSYYDPYPVDDYYAQYYNLGSPDAYRYADDVLYRVDPQSNAITSIAALLTGDQFAVGQRLPAGYDVYNVPYEYQDQYYDTPEYDYRYSDGYVYQVDPTTQLIQAAIQLLT